jgi:cytochrome P450
MTEIAAREIESWPTGVPYKLRPRMQAITLEIIIETVFGVHDGERMEPLREALRDFLDLTTNPRVLLPVLMVGPDRVDLIPAFRRRVERVDRLIAAEIAGRRAAEDLAEREDVLSMLVSARHEDGSPMSDKEIRDELLTLLVAGHETTATALSWAMERLTRHPEKLERLRAEVLDGEDAYLTATIVIVVRKLTEAVELGGYELPAGAGVTPCIHLIHRDPRIYPDPDRFLPERFIDNPPGTYTWIPFGGGVRRCLAASYAEMEMKRVLRAVLATVDLRPASARSERMRKSAISFSPDQSGLVIAEPREADPAGPRALATA